MAFATIFHFQATGLRVPAHGGEGALVQVRALGSLRGDLPLADDQRAWRALRQALPPGAGLVEEALSDTARAGRLALVCEQSAVSQMCFYINVRSSTIGKWSDPYIRNDGFKMSFLV